MLRHLVGLLLTFFVFPVFAAEPQKIPDLQPSVLLISIDGFRWDYLPKIATPNLHRLMKEGTSAEALIPSFPTKTFPNHYTIVTGLYPSHHGIIANNIWDPDLQAKFTMDDRAAVGDGRWWGGEPIWVTAEKAGLKVAPECWPGSEAEIEGMRPTYWKPYDKKESHEHRLSDFFALLDKPAADRPAFFTLYFEDVDNAGHDFGPFSPELVRAVQKVDATLGTLIAGLQERGVFDKLNVIVVSDHGMVSVRPQDVVFLDDYIDLASVRIADWSPVLMVSAGTKRDETIAAIRKAPHVTVYKREEVPERLHFSGNRRIPDVIALADPGWNITSHKRFAERKKPSHGDHGYDNRFKDTWAIFIGHGPAFRSGKRIPPFANIHIYSALAAILGVPPAPNDGSLSVLAPALRVPIGPRPETVPQTIPPRKAPAADHRSRTAAR